MSLEGIIIDFDHAGRVKYPNEEVIYPNEGVKYPNEGVKYPNEGVKYPNEGINYPTRRSARDEEQAVSIIPDIILSICIFHVREVHSKYPGTSNQMLQPSSGGPLREVVV